MSQKIKFLVRLPKNEILQNIQKFFFLIVVLFLGMACRTSNKEIQLKKITLAEAMQPIASPVYIAANKLFFIQEGLDVKLVPFPTGKLCLDTVLGGKADVGTVAETPLMHVGFQKQQIAILCTMHYARKNTKCVARKDSGIEKPEDIKGKKIGVPVGTNAEYFMFKFLEKYNIDIQDVKVLNLNPPEMVGAIVRGDIDASFSWEPHITRTINQLNGKAILFFGDDIYRETYNIVCLKNWADKNSQIVEKFLRALMKATDYIHSNKDESVKIVADHIQIESDELSEIWHYYTFKIVLDQLLMDALIDEAKWAIASGIQKEQEVPNYSYMFYTGPLKSIDPKAVNIEIIKKE